MRWASMRKKKSSALPVFEAVVAGPGLEAFDLGRSGQEWSGNPLALLQMHLRFPDSIILLTPTITDTG
jgi:hypothetical protein